MARWGWEPIQIVDQRWCGIEVKIPVPLVAQARNGAKITATIQGLEQAAKALFRFAPDDVIHLADRQGLLGIEENVRTADNHRDRSINSLHSLRCKDGVDQGECRGLDADEIRSAVAYLVLQLRVRQTVNQAIENLNGVGGLLLGEAGHIQ